MKDYKVVLIALLAGITIFSGFKYFSALREKYDLMANLNQVNSQVTALENEKQSLMQNLDKEKELQKVLSQENLQFKDDLQLNKDKLTQIEGEFQAAQKTVEELNSQVSAVKAENTALRDQIEGLKVEVTQVSQDREALKARLSSITELKKAIKELRQQIRKAKKAVTIRTKEGEIILGNLGFIIKDGKPTYPSKVRIEVEPLPSKN
jgi:chromosome segregation ATPase